MATIGSLSLKVSARAGEFHQALDGVKRRLRALGKVGALQGVTKAFKGAASTAANFDGTLANLVGKIPIVGGLLSAVAGAGLTQWIKGNLEMIASTGRVADKLGLTTETLLALRKASAAAGVDEAQLEGAVYRLSRTLGQAALGSKEAVDSFRLLGFTEQQLAGMDTEETLKAVIDRLAAVPSHAERAAAAYKVFGKGAEAILGPLAQGAHSLDEIKAAMAAAGTSFSRLDSAKAELAERAIAKLNGTFKALGVQLALEVAPVIIAIAEQLQGMAKSGELKGIATDFAEGLVVTLAICKDIGHVLVTGFKAAQLSLDVVIASASQSLAWLLKLAGKLPDALGGKAAREGAEQLQGIADEFAKSSIDRANDLNKRLEEPWATSKATEFFDAAKKRADELAKAQERDKGKGNGLAEAQAALKIEAAIDKTTKTLQEQINTYGRGKGFVEAYKLAQEGASAAQLEGVKSLANELDVLERLGGLMESSAGEVAAYEMSVRRLAAAYDAGQISLTGMAGATAKLQQELDKKLDAGALKLFDESLTPLQKFQGRLADLERLLQTGRIGWDLYAQGVARAADELEKLQKGKLPQALERGSAGAFSAVTKSQAEGRADKDQQARVAAILEDQRKKQDAQIQKQAEANQYLRDLIEKLGTVVKI